MTARSLAAATVVLRSVLMGEEQGRADNAVMDDATAAKERGRKGSVSFILPQLNLHTAENCPRRDGKCTVIFDTYLKYLGS